MSDSEIAIAIAAAGADDMAALAAALTALSADLGDPHRATEATLAAACLGPSPACHGILAQACGTVAGAALVSPLFSTTRGGAGGYVSDLWVAPAWRGAGLGRRLLGAVAGLAVRRWGARFLKLAVYDDNPGAAAFYTRLGFAALSRERAYLLAAPGFAALVGDGG